MQLWEQTDLTEASVLKFRIEDSESDELEHDDEQQPKETSKETSVPVETTDKRQEPDELKDVTAKMAQLVVDAAEKKEEVSAWYEPFFLVY